MEKIEVIAYLKAKANKGLNPLNDCVIGISAGSSVFFRILVRDALIMTIDVSCAPEDEFIGAYRVLQLDKLPRNQSWRMLKTMLNAVPDDSAFLDQAVTASTGYASPVPVLFQMLAEDRFGASGEGLLGKRGDIVLTIETA